MFDRHFEVAQLAQVCCQFIFQDEDFETLDLLALLKGDQDEQIGLLMDFLDIGEIPAAKPKKLNSVFWKLITQDASTTPFPLKLARITSIVGVLSWHQSVEFFQIGDLGNSILAYGQANSLLGRAFEAGATYYGRDSLFEHRQKLSKAGEQGAAAKNQKFKALTDWALSQAKGMKDQDIDVARKLSALLPQYLANVSKNPERLIYDALRARYRAD